ncbi:divalent cation tolerance protein CutA [Moorena sp. SIOASIH]|uniref:divalent-cation tolerance protein CutA n=1 Tax=Moorena sp. SIOASIH TaxID=2607817 RepID=UPI0025DAF510|nr:divalent cation tolerance protein CutA [Moorena sp. SIOASIH]
MKIFVTNLLGSRESGVGSRESGVGYPPISPSPHTSDPVRLRMLLVSRSGDIVFLSVFLIKMKLYYVTLNTTEEASKISKALLEQKLAVCTNWFPITCAYSWEGKIVEEPETVLIIKT